MVAQRNVVVIEALVRDSLEHMARRNIPMQLSLVPRVFQRQRDDCKPVKHLDLAHLPLILYLTVAPGIYKLPQCALFRPPRPNRIRVRLVVMKHGTKNKSAV